MRTIINNVYTYSELSDEAKQRALESYRANDYQHEYAWSDEYRNTDDDSITARDTFNAVCDQSDNLRCIFTPRQVQALTKIN